MTSASAGHAPGTSPKAARSFSVRTWADLVVLAVLSVLGVAGFESSFGGNGYLVAGLAGLAVGMAVGILSAVLRLGAVTTTLAAIAGYFLLGTAAAVPSEGLFGVVPTLNSLASLATGAVYGWSDIVTLTTPIGAPAYIGAVPFAATWLVGLVFTVLATRWLSVRPRVAWRSAVVLAGPVVLFLVGILTGTDSAYEAGSRGVSFAVIALVWVGWRRQSIEKIAVSSQGGLVRRKLVGTAVVVAAAVVLGVTAGALVAPTTFHRFVLRDQIQPPFDPLDYPSPLAGYRHYTKDAAKTVLFTATGLVSGERIRIATLDMYDGKLWNVAGPQFATSGSGTFNLVGARFPEPALITPGGLSTVTINVKGYSDVWMPSVGYPSGIVLAASAATKGDDLRYNTATGTVVLTSGVKAGDRFVVTAQSQKAFTAGQLSKTAPARLRMPAINNVPDIVAAKAAEFAADATTPIGKLSAIEAAFKSTGYLSHGLKSDSARSQAGHGADRMTTLLTRSPMVGDQEQYASVFALMARQLGYPARVVMGFAPKVSSGSSTVEVTGSDVTAWVEVAFEGVGWISFDPTPKQTNAPKDQTTTGQSEPLPQVRQPPRTNQLHDNILSPVVIDKSKDKRKNSGFELPGWAYLAAGVIGIPALLYFVPVLVVASVKRRRRKRRRTRGTPDRRAAGAWDELADMYAELGFTVNRKASRRQTAAEVRQQEDRVRKRRSSRVAPDARGDSSALPDVAMKIDRAVFSGVDVEPSTVHELWSDAQGIIHEARSAAGWGRRQLSLFRVRAKRDWVGQLTAAAPTRSRRSKSGHTS